MATWADVRRVAAALPEATESADSGGLVHWRVRNKSFVWERPLRRSDLDALGDGAPDGPVLCARVPGAEAKQAMIAAAPGVYFTTPHFNGYPAVLIRLEEIDPAELEEVVVEAWLDRAPKALARQYLASRADLPGD